MDKKMLMMMALMGNKDSNMSNILPFLLLNDSSGISEMDPVMMMALMGNKDGNMSNILPFLLLSLKESKSTK